MKPSGRKLIKWRDKSPMIHRSFADKRSRGIKHIKEEIKSYKGVKENDNN